MRNIKHARWAMWQHDDGINGISSSTASHASFTNADANTGDTTAPSIATPVVQLEQVSKRYGNREVLHSIDWSIQSGECWGVIGPNGSGKTTLMQLIAGTEHVHTGQVSLQGQALSSYRRRDIARFMAVLRQDGLAPLHDPVREVVAMGRYPYQNWLGRDEDPDVEKLLHTIMERLDLLSLADKPLDQLSGGQRQRVAFAKVMAQQPQLLLLDEPTTYLDIAYQVHFMEWLDQWRKETGITVVAVLHDLNLAARYCDRLLALDNGQVLMNGTPQQLMQEDVIRQLFHIQPAIVHHDEIDVPQLLLKRGKGMEARKAAE
ncbi:ABC transporter ATP-binding protein [Paenibacillus sp. WLX2291]|uniref:ABC transporter ATP-binding protein n=1 Tax=Paenibacillus sp. WLX2291 TaxID=3296934 RepID=UPI003983EE1B